MMRATNTIFLYPSTTKELRTFAGAASSCKVDEMNHVIFKHLATVKTYSEIALSDTAENIVKLV